jgi:hypothetical protein
MLIVVTSDQLNLSICLHVCWIGEAYTHNGTHNCCSGAHREMYHFLLQESVWMCQSETRGTRFVWGWLHARNP